MSRLQSRLGYGRVGDVELDSFTRLLTNQIFDNEEVRLDKPLSWDNTYEYVSLALAGSSIDDPVWDCIRRTWVNNRCVRMQYQPNIAWSNRANGWT